MGRHSVQPRCPEASTPSFISFGSTTWDGYLEPATVAPWNSSSTQQTSQNPTSSRECQPTTTIMGSYRNYTRGFVWKWKRQRKLLQRSSLGRGYIAHLRIHPLANHQLRPSWHQCRTWPLFPETQMTCYLASSTTCNLRSDLLPISTRIHRLPLRQLEASKHLLGSET